jgi:LacI family transcriptional regulator
VIQTDDASGVEAAVEHLIAGGCRKIAYVDGGVRASNTTRAEAVASTLRDHGLTAPLQRFSAPVDAWRSPRDLAAEIAADLPEALVCYDDLLALALMDALRDLGIRIPAEIQIVGFDGIPFASISNPRLTTVVVPSAEMGRVAAVSLIGAVRDHALPAGVLLPVRLVTRESTRDTSAPTKP